MAPPSRRHPVQTITDVKALSALANEQRSRIFQVLVVEGPSTASALAARTESAVGSASHHLKVLNDAGLIETAPELARDRRERWWRAVAPSIRWSRAEFADDAGAVTAARAAESLELQRQFERTRDWLATSGSTGPWDGVAFAAQLWMTLSPAELGQLGEELIDLLQTWRYRTIPDDGVERETVFVYAHAFPDQP